MPPEGHGGQMCFPVGLLSSLPLEGLEDEHGGYNGGKKEPQPHSSAPSF